MSGGQYEIGGVAAFAKNGCEVVGEAGVGSVDAVGVVDHGFALGEKPGDGEGHGDAVIAMGIDFRAFEWLPAVDDHAVLELLHIGSHFPEVIDGGGDAVGFFYAQFAGVA